jgi:S-DNA-T family DNA segregation ATPase FtsK/SpoIIIE
MRWSHEASASSPWLPPLAHRIALSELRGDGDGSSEGEIVLGRADDPARQMQPPEVLSPGRERGIAVLGAPGSGRSSLVRTVAAQCSDVCVVPRDPEAAIDLLTAWNSAAEAVPTLVLCDDIDAIHADLPAEYAQEFAHGWERIVRSSPETTWVLTAGRATGGMGRVLDALPRRALLRLPSRLDHLAAGGEGSGFLRDRGAGRARIGDREVQFAWVEPGDVVLPQRSSEGAWSPTLHMTALVTPAAESVAAALRAAHPEWTVVGQRDLAVEPAGHVSAPRILVADAEAWHREWAIWQQIRAQGEVLVRAERPSDLRQLVGQRDAPPYARPHAGRAWSVVGDRPARRVVVPALTRA